MVLQGSGGRHGGVDWMDTLWLHVPFWEFLAYNSELCGRLSHKPGGGDSKSSSVGNTHVKVTHGLRIALSKVLRAGRKNVLPRK